MRGEPGAGSSTLIAPSPTTIWLAVNQFTVTENRHTRRPDIVLFVNGLPLAVMELKNPAWMRTPPFGRPGSSSRPTRQSCPPSSR